MRINLLMVCCFTNRFYIKPQPGSGNAASRYGCFTNRFYIKPQPNELRYPLLSVALLIVSTSNRNNNCHNQVKRTVALLIVSTSNRNSMINANGVQKLLY